MWMTNTRPLIRSISFVCAYHVLSGTQDLNNKLYYPLKEFNTVYFVPRIFFLTKGKDYTFKCDFKYLKNLGFILYSDFYRVKQDIWPDLSAA